MNLRHVAACGLLCLLLTALGGCDQGRERPGQVTLQVANAAPGFEQLGFFRGPRDQGATLGFRGATAFAFDADTYRFLVYQRSLDQAVAGREANFQETLLEDHGYTIVLTDEGGSVGHALLEYEPPAASNAQVLGFHAGGGLPAVDLYLAPAGAGIAGTAPRGTLAPLGKLAAQTLAEGQYDIWLTAAGDPATVLFTSTAVTLSAGATTTLVITPEGGQGTTAMSVMLLQASPTVLYDRNATAEVRAINGAGDGQPRDLAYNGQFTPPLFSAVPYGAPTSYVTIPLSGEQPLQVTPAGNPGVIELSQAYRPAAGSRETLIFGGAPEALLLFVVPEDGRRLHYEAKLRLFNVASQFTTGLEFLLLAKDASPTDALADASLVTPGASTIIPRRTGEYDLYVRQNGTTTIVSGPTRLTLNDGGIYGVLAVNGPDANSASIVLFDDFP